MQDNMVAMLHGDMDAQRNGTRIRRMMIIFGIGTAIAICLIVASFIWRDATHLNNPNETASQVVTIAITAVWGSLVIFLWSMKLSPLLAYRRYLRDIKGGLSRDVEGVVTQFDDAPTFRDGLNFYAMIVNVGDTNDPEDERLLYWDAHLARPEIHVGDRVQARAHGNDIIALTKA